MIVLLLLIGLASGVSDPADHAQDSGDAFERGNELYLMGDFESALDSYKRAAGSQDVRGAVLYNMGNCLFRLDRCPEALYEFLRAKRCIPRSPKVAENIRVTRERLGLGTINADSGRSPGGTLMRWIRWFTSAEYLLAAAWVAVVLLLWGAHALWKGSPDRSRFAVFTAAALALLLVLAAFSSSAFRKRCAVVASASEVLSEPSPKAGDVLSVLKEGETVPIAGKACNGWRRVDAGGNRTGWVREGDLLVLP